MKKNWKIIRRIEYIELVLGAEGCLHPTPSSNVAASMSHVCVLSARRLDRLAAAARTSTYLSVGSSSLSGSRRASALTKACSG